MRAHRSSRGFITLIAILAMCGLSAAPVQATIYGDRDVRGSIEVRYLATGGPSGFLGFPLTNELPTLDGSGRYNGFQGGSIYWSPRTNGAWEVHGGIEFRWDQLGREQGPLGYPLSNEDTTPDGIGRVNHFQGGKIYWTPATGAQEIYGAISQLWVSLGYETSQLGYPTSGEYAIPGGRRSNFEGGFITWTPGGGPVATFNPTSVVRGVGTDVVQISKPAGPMLARIRTTGPTDSNLIVSSRLGSAEGDLLVNEIGETDMVVPLDFKNFRSAPPQTTAFSVRADTSWEITLIPLSATGAFGRGTVIGEARSTVWRYVGPPGVVRFTNADARSNFIVVAYNLDTGYSDLLVNEIGNFDGSVPIGANQYLEIVSDGQWTAVVR